VSPIPVPTEFPWFLFSEGKEGKEKECSFVRRYRHSC